MDDWRTTDVDELIAALLRLETDDEAARFLRDLCTLGELRDLAQRWAVVRRLDAGEHYAAISRATGASACAWRSRTRAGSSNRPSSSCAMRDSSSRSTSAASSPASGTSTST